MAHVTGLQLVWRTHVVSQPPGGDSRRVFLGTVTPVLPVYADPAGSCPDGHMLVPAATVTGGQAKDRNNNYLICGKLGSDGKVHGGPDDIDDIL